jgi:hypothetical protein
VGTVQASTVPITSALRLKTQITPLTEVLVKLAQLRGVAFAWNGTAVSLTGRTPGRPDIGVITQELVLGCRRHGSHRRG